MEQETKAEEIASASEDWILEDWANSHELLVFGDAACVVDLGIIKLRFSFYKTTASVYEKETGSIKYTYYSLCIEKLKAKCQNCVVKVVATVSLPSETFIREGFCNLDGLKKGDWMTIIDEFLIISKSKDGKYIPFPSGSFSSYLLELEKLTVNVSVSLFGFTNTKNGVDMKNVAKTQATKSMISQLKKLYLAEENFSDLKIMAKDNVVLRAHKFQIAARSETFLRLVEKSVKQNDFDGTIPIPDVNSKPLQVILYWMYTGELQEDIGNVMEEVVEAALKYELRDLMKILNKKLINVCTVENMFRLYGVAKKNGMTSAIEDIKDFIKTNL